MSSFAQTPDGDLALTVGRLTIIRGKEEKAQKIKNRLKLFLGEWFLDTRVGVPWFQVVFVKNPDLEVVKSLFRRVILSVEGMVDVEEVSLVWDRQARTLSYEWRAIDDEGQEINGADERPFIVETDQ